MAVYRKLFFKNKRILILSIFLLVIMVIIDLHFMYAIIPQKAVYDMLHHILSSEFCIFVAMLFISFDYYTHILHGEVIEIVLAMPGGRKRMQRRMIFWMILCNILVTGFQILLLCIYYGMIGFGDIGYIGYSIVCVLVYMFGANLAAILFAWLVAGLNSYWKGCMLLLLPVFLNSNFFMDSVITDMNWHFAANGVTYTPSLLFSCLYLLPAGLGYAENKWYYVSVIAPHIYKVIFWIIFFVFCIFCRGVQPSKPLVKKLLYMGAGICCMVLFGIFVFVPYSDFVQNSDPWGAWQCMETYYESEDHTQKEEQAEFQVIKYSMDLDLKRKLKVDVTMELSNQALKRYKFTLDHNYTLKQVKDQNGQELAYEREGDYITVFSEETLDSITMEYEGIHPLYYTNSQGICLPSYFCYYPRAGWHRVYCMEENIAHGYEGSFLETASEFDVTVDCLQEYLYSNLKETAPNHFTGSETGISLFGGFVECYEYDGVRVIMSRLEYFTGNEKGRIDEMISNLKSEGLPEDSLIVAMPWPACTLFRASDSQMFCNGVYDIEYSVPYYLEHGTDIIPLE